MAVMLCVRRASVTVALQTLESKGLIRAEQGYVTITSRSRSREFATDAYVFSQRLTTFEIGTIYGISLRFYEDQGLLLSLVEDGTRFYTAKDRIKLELIIKGKKLGFSFIELKLLILHTIEQRAAFDVSLLDTPPFIQSLAAERLVEEIWQAERKIEELQTRIRELQLRLAEKGQAS